MKKADAIQWLNNRGNDYIESDIKRCKSIGDYMFIVFKEYPNEVELYNRTDMYGECYAEYDLKTFKWNKDHMRKVITGEWNYVEQNQ